MRCSVLPPQSNFIRKATVCLLSFIPICAESEAVGMVISMEPAKMTSNGQSTIPVDALLEVQTAFRGTADELGIKDEQGVVDMVKEIRAERRDDYQSE